jgi:hypothetical protein
MAKFLTALVIVLLIIGVVLLGLGYIGLAPGLAGLLGANTPRDLGVRYTAADLASGEAKTGTKTIALPAGAAPQDSFTVTGSIPVKVSFTDEELTALAAQRAKQWQYYPVSDAQIKIHDDGTVEASGVLSVGRAYACAAALGFSAPAVDAALGALRVVGGYPAVYAKGTGAVTDGQVTLDVQHLEIGRLPVSAELLAQNQGAIVSGIEQIIRAAGVSARSVTFANGELQFDGSHPETRALSPAQ